MFPEDLINIIDDSVPGAYDGTPIVAALFSPLGERFAKENWVGDPALGSTLQDAITEIGADPATLKIPTGSHPIAVDLIIPATLTLLFERGALLAIADGATLTMNSQPDAGPYQIFSCAGSGAVTGLRSALPEWFGAIGDDTEDDSVPLQACVNASVQTYLLWGKTFKTTVGVIVPDNSVIEGDGAIHQSDDAVEGLILKDNVTIRNIGLTGAAAAYSGPNYHVGIIPYSFRNGSGNDPSTGALALWVSGNRMRIDNVKFTAWDVAVWAGLNSTIQNCKATDNWREGFYAGGPGCRVLFNEIDGTDGWAIDFNAGDSQAIGNKIKNCGRALSDGGGICFAGMTSEKPMTNLTAIANNINDCGVGYGIVVISKPTDGVWGDLNISANIINGADSTSALDGIFLYVGGGSTVTCKNIKIDNNIITNFIRMIVGVYLEGGSIRGNVGKTIAPAILGAMAFAGLSRITISSNEVSDVNGVANTAMFIEGTLNNCKIINNIGEGANVGFWFATGASGTGNDISGNDFSGCGYPIYLQEELPAGNYLERNIGYVPYHIESLAVQEIIDRIGIFGDDAYDFDEGVLTGPEYNLSVNPGIYWNTIEYFVTPEPTVFSMASLPTDSYYMYVLSDGTVVISDTWAPNTVRNFYWDASTHTISWKSVHPGIAVLFSGEEFANQLVSTARSKSFTSVADRLEEIEQLLPSALDYSYPDIAVASDASEEVNGADFANRGLCHYLKVAETGGLVTGTYDIEIFSKDTFLAADLLYQAVGIDPATDYEDWLPFWLADDDETTELHVKITNHDLAAQGTYDLTLRCERFA